MAQENFSNLNRGNFQSIRKKKRLAGASAITSPELSGAPEGEKTTRSSSTIMARNIPELQELKDIVGNFSPPIIEPAELRAWIKETFPD